MDRTIRIRNRTISQIEAILTFAQQMGNTTTENAVRPRLANLEKHYEHFNEIEVALAEYPDYESVTTKVDSQYYEARTLLDDVLVQLTGVKQSNGKTTDDLNETLETFVAQQKTFYETLNTTSTVKLPKINVEAFSGDYKMWPSFRDLYVNAVHNHPHLKGSQKLQQLKTLLRGEAAGLIRHITTTDDNYAEAWQKLEVRYNKPKPIVTTLIQSFLDQRACKTANYKDLRQLYDHSDEVVRALRSLGSEEESRDPWLIHLLLQKVDCDTKQLWARDSVLNPHPTFNEFLEFLNTRCDTLESCNIQEKRTPAQLTRSFLVENASHSQSQSTRRIICYVCKGDHLIFKCPAFRNMSLEARINLSKEQRLCHNCLRQGHFITQCLSKTSCLICRRRHHSLLHPHTPLASHPQTVANTAFIDQLKSNGIANSDQSYTASINSVKTNQPDQTPTSSSNTTNNLTTDTQLFMQQQSIAQTILPTAIIKIRSRSGEYMSARVLLDSGSQSSFVSETFVQRLGLTREKSNIHVYGLAAVPAGITKGRTELYIQSRVKPLYTILVNALIVKSIGAKLPASLIPVPPHNHYETLGLADPLFFEPRTIDVLIGIEFFFDIIGPKQLHVPHLPPLQESQFGWLVAGGVNLNISQTNSYLSTNESSREFNQDELNNLLKRFWEIEDLPTRVQPTKEEQFCEKLFNSSTLITTNGRIQVRIPFREEREYLGDSYNNAKRRLMSMERKFQQNPELQQQYTEFMNEYITNDHMARLQWSNVPDAHNKRYFIPHHAIFKESATTPLRVVFDASCKTSTALSLNDVMYTGTKLQNDLITILLRFRKHQIVFVADVEKMYRQIMVHKDDANYQLVLWRNNVNQDIQVYQLRTVTYGMNCSPYLAIRTLNRIAEEHSNEFPTASNAILHDFYMDDLLSGADSSEEALRLKTEITSILEKRGLHLRKWRSNSQEVLDSFDPSDIELNPKLIEEESNAKTLGILWNSRTDTFSFKVQLQETNIWTKRKVLSETSRVYDPLGWITPTIMLFKIILQKFWVLKLDWDLPLPSTLQNEFKATYSQLTQLNQIEIPRCYHQSTVLKTVQIHAFCDASEKAYGCAVYIRVSGFNGKTTTNLICAKGKVAPIKQVSLPRLELCGASVLAKLVNYVKSELFPEDQVQIFAWTDSLTVLSWLSDVPRRWKSFIAKRTSYILDIVPRHQWNYVPSKQNPADMITRGVSPQKICTTLLWWKGPEWLEKDDSWWPEPPKQTPKVNPELLEQRTQIFVIQNVQVEPDELFTATSSFFKLKRILVYVLRFGRRSLIGNNKTKGPITLNEMLKAEEIIYKLVQRHNFMHEIEELRKHGHISNASKLSALDPFIDDKGILRVGGRLRHSELRYSAKHPIILPKNHPINELIIKEVHHSLLHGGLSLVLNTIRQRYWILDARRAAKRFINHCVTCIRHRGATLRPKMGNLPVQRVLQTRPFQNCGIDYAGPLMIKTSNRRIAPVEKAYLAIFVCLSVKAVHLEVVSSMNTESFLAALKRFVARQGLPDLIWCDNGSNFIGGNRELKILHNQFISQLKSNDILNFCLQKSIQFKFIPPSGPNFGGLWEAGVKSTKFHLKRVMAGSNFTYEELCTLIAQIESILNSRPLCRVNDTVDELQMLTPSHFLIGEPLVAIPEPDLAKINNGKLNKWQNIQKRIQGFWKCWHQDYLTTLQNKSKWRKGSENLEPNDVVLLRENGLPPNRWLLGRVTQIFPGVDKICRVVKVKTANNEIIRPKSIQFKFIPPSGPNFGGLWEAGVKSTKFHLKRVMAGSNFTYEELCTLVAQIESILNSRPLCRVNDTVDELQMLTPSHFLIGEPLVAIPEPDLAKINNGKLNKWQNIQKRIQGFWKCWHQDYLTTLQNKSKWRKGSENLEPNDVVLLRENGLPPNRWLLGRVTQIFPGVDKICRVVKVKTANNEIIRPVNKLIKLPLKD